MAEVSAARSGGYLAGRAGAALSENPHEPGTDEHRDWRAGWTKAEADVDAENVHVQFREPRRG